MTMSKTFDVDPKRSPNGYVSLGEEELEKVRRALLKCPHAGVRSARRSASGNGFHVSVGCERDCEICSLTLDSPRRMELDGVDPPWTRGVLWDSKTFSKGGSRITMEAGEWMRL